MTQLVQHDGALGVRAGPDGGPPRLTGRDLVQGYTATDIEADRAQVAFYASLCRVLESALVQNKLAVFGLMARTAAANASEFRQQVIDDLWVVAEDLGLVALVGVTSVQCALGAAFAEATS